MSVRSYSTDGVGHVLRLRSVAQRIRVRNTGMRRLKELRVPPAILQKKKVQTSLRFAIWERELVMKRRSTQNTYHSKSSMLGIHCTRLHW